MRVRPLGAIDGVGLHFHPTERLVFLRRLLLSRLRPILRHGVAGSFPLRTTGRCARVTDGAMPAVVDVYQLHADVGMHRVANDLGPGFVWRNMPGIKRGNHAQLPSTEMDFVE